MFGLKLITVTICMKNQNKDKYRKVETTFYQFIYKYIIMRNVFKSKARECTINDFDVSGVQPNDKLDSYMPLEMDINSKKKEEAITLCYNNHEHVYC